MASSRTIVIAGAGIGGLTAALALAARGFRIIIMERAERLEEVGAGLQLSPNASRILIALGLEQRLSQQAVIPDSISISSVRAGGEIACLPLGAKASARAGAPYWVIHRADLQRTLAEAVEAHPNIELRLGCAFETATDAADGVTIISRQGSELHNDLACALIGADGVWSRVRHLILPDLQPRFTGKIAWRGTLDAGQLPREDATPRVRLWMGPTGHLVAYPISAARQFNVVAVVPGEWKDPGWSTPGDASEPRGVFDTPLWPAPARRLVAAVPGWRKWALFGVPEGIEWTRGRIALLGDAAHAMLPFVAQGAGMAIEDAAVLADGLAKASLDAPDGVATALKSYAMRRRPRVTRVQQTARSTGQIYHLSGPVALARDLTIRALGPERMLARNGWIYDWKP